MKFELGISMQLHNRESIFVLTNIDKVYLMINCTDATLLKSNSNNIQFLFNPN